MSAWTPSLAPPGPAGEPNRHRLFGVYPGLVTDVVDPDGQGRVQVQLPWVGERDAARATAWARLATFMASPDRGSWFIPEVRDEVLLSFVAGDPRHPVVIGALWNGVDAPPETMDRDGGNNIRSFTSRSGHKLSFDDTSGSEKVTLVTRGGHKLVLDDTSEDSDSTTGQDTITLRHRNGAEITIDSSGTVSISALNKVNIDAPAGLNITAAMVSVEAALSKFSGVVKADTVITNAVVSSSYTPGAGNIW